MVLIFDKPGELYCKEQDQHRDHHLRTVSSKAVVPVLVLLFVALSFILRGDLF